MNVVWTNEINWVVPPPKMVANVIHKMIREKSHGILIVPIWKSAPYWPLLTSSHKYKSFVSDTIVFQKETHVCPGLGNNGMFTDTKISFQMIACWITPK